jgi:uncharacterized membrane protein (DUF4010 family)
MFYCKLYSSRGLYYTSVRGGMVSSTVTIGELAQFLAAAPWNVMSRHVIDTVLMAEWDSNAL